MFPFGTGETFLEPEIEILSQYTDNLTIVPRLLLKTQRKVPANIKVDISFAKAFDNKFLKFSSFLYTKGFVSTTVKEISRFKGNISFIKLTASSLFESEVAKKWAKEKVTSEDTLFYTYWLAKYTLGLSQFAVDRPNIKVASRAHGHDLYEYIHTPPALPFREETLKLINKVYCISAYGNKYLSEKYPAYNYKYGLSKLGVLHPGFVNDLPESTFAITSCSRVIPLKRVDLIFKGIKAFATSNPAECVHWTHLGEGPLRKEFIRSFNKEKPKNLSIDFPGQLSNADVVRFYKKNAVNCFINASTSEGIAVSIMEAQSCGIPVIATAVGGTPEIVDNSNGILLPANPTVDEIKLALEKFTDSNAQQQKRKKSRENWEANYNAEKNYKQFYDEISQIFSPRLL